MGLNCGAGCAKYVLFAFNIIFFLGGAAVLGVGIWIRVDTGSYQDFLTKVDPSGQTGTVTANVLSDNIAYIHAIAYVLIGIGAFVFVVGFLGCCGAIKEIKALLVAYAICLIIIMSVEVGVGIAVGVYKDKVRNEITGQMNRWAAEYDFQPTTVDGNNILKPTVEYPANYNSSAVPITIAFNAMQVYLGCCGVSNNYNDFETLKSPYSNRKPFGPPAFCCKMSDKPTLKLVDGNCASQGIHTSENSNFDTGCLNKVKTFVEKNVPAVIGVAVGIGMIELFGVIFSFCLCCAIGGDKKQRYN